MFISTVPITGTFTAMVVVWITNIILNLLEMAITLSEKDMSHEELKLTNLLYDVKVHLRLPLPRY